jgi:hypothetical protein
VVKINSLLPENVLLITMHKKNFNTTRGDRKTSVAATLGLACFAKHTAPLPFALINACSGVAPTADRMLRQR